MNTKSKAWLNLGLFLATIAINALGAFGLINGMTQKAVSDKYYTLITPSPSTFSIWGVIYTLLLIALVWMAVKHSDEKAARVIDAISPAFWASSAANILWIVTFSMEWIGVSTLLILALVISLALLNTRLSAPEGIGQKVNALAFGLYNGWLIAATLVNVAAFLVQVNWDRFGLSQDAWALIILVVGLLLTIVLELRMRNAALPLPIAWAYYGISQEHRTAERLAGQYPTIITVALVIAALYVVLAVVLFVLNGRCLLPLRDKRKAA